MVAFDASKLSVADVKLLHGLTRLEHVDIDRGIPDGMLESLPEPDSLVLTNCSISDKQAWFLIKSRVANHVRIYDCDMSEDARSLLMSVGWVYFDQ
jgi:hypothetical protein